jgi:hypothetical protein
MSGSGRYLSPKGSYDWANELIPTATTEPSHAATIGNSGAHNGANRPQSVRQKVLMGNRPSLPVHCHPLYSEMVHLGWAPESTARPCAQGRDDDACMLQPFNQVVVVVVVVVVIIIIVDIVDIVELDFEAALMKVWMSCSATQLNAIEEASDISSTIEEFLNTADGRAFKHGNAIDTTFPYHQNLSYYLYCKHCGIKISLTIYIVIIVVLYDVHTYPLFIIYHIIVCPLLDPAVTPC